MGRPLFLCARHDSQGHDLTLATAEEKAEEKGYA